MRLDSLGSLSKPNLTQTTAPALRFDAKTQASPPNKGTRESEMNCRFLTFLALLRCSGVLCRSFGRVRVRRGVIRTLAPLMTYLMTVRRNNKHLRSLLILCILPLFRYSIDMGIGDYTLMQNKADSSTVVQIRYGLCFPGSFFLYWIGTIAFLTLSPF